MLAATATRASAISSWTDFISDWMAYTDNSLSPQLFRKWAGIGMVSAALERRVWVRTGGRIAYPNMFTMLVAPPGVGKYVVEEARELMEQTTTPGTKVPAFHVAPDSMTKASVIDTLAKSRQLFIATGNGVPLQYHSLFLAAEEFGVLLPGYDLEFIGTLNSIWNNKAKHTEVRRTGSVREVSIEAPQLSMLAGVQPGWLGSVFPEEAWSTGLASRMIMIYASETPLRDLFEEPPDQTMLRNLILAKLGLLSQLYGQFKWEPAAAERLSAWHSAGGPPAPTHSKLVYYNNRRTLHVLKLIMVSAIAASAQLVITESDVARAIAWLVEAELVMPDIFRAMVGKSDSQVIDEMHYYMTAVWAKNKGKPVHERMLYDFLRLRVPSEKIEKIVAIAERANIIARVAGTADQYVPKPKHEHGLE